MQKTCTTLLNSVRGSETIRYTVRMASTGSKVLTPENINPNVITMEYAVRGPLVIRAVELEKELAAVSTFLYSIFYIKIYFQGCTKAI